MTNDTNDLTECDKEPIHIPSAIQPHGFFMAIHPSTYQIIALSTNMEDFFTVSAPTILGQPLKTLFPTVSEWIIHSGDDRSPLPQVFSLEHTRETKPFILVLHRTESYWLLEGEPAEQIDLHPEHLAQSVINEAIRLSSAKSVDELCRFGVDSLRRLSGFGRVMLYKFDEEYNGCVTAESKIADMDAYLDHHFPAADIPLQARELYRKNLIRFIPSSTYTPIPLLSLSPHPIDMSDSILRSVSPIHLEYLRNMEVGASMSLSIIVNGELWGLFACHHPYALPMPYTVRRHCEMFIRLFNALIEEKSTNEASQTFFRLQNSHSALKAAFQTLSSQSSLDHAFTALGPLWLQAMDSDGVCLLHNGDISAFGTIPETREIQSLLDIIDPLHQNGVYASSSLREASPDGSWNDSAGVLSVLISSQPPIRILWFRHEWVRDLKWAGHPDKSTIDPTQRISPRKSFETLIVEQRGKSHPWSRAHLMAAELYKEIGSIINLTIAHQSMERQNQLLIQQGKMAMMGEMIGAIAHQWNQPLNALSLLISGLSELIDESDVDHQSLEQIKQTGMEKIRFMSETIDAFRNFFKPDRRERSFSTTHSIKEVSEHLLPQLKLRRIALSVDEDPGMIHGYPNEFKQVILILLTNAHDALISKKITDPWIRCTLERSSQHLQLHICDNAGGIDPEHLKLLFTPYFSTKEEGGGRGIGLYLSKLIMEEHFKGEITVKNSSEGACFTLTFNT